MSDKTLAEGKEFVIAYYWRLASVLESKEKLVDANKQFALV